GGPVARFSLATSETFTNKNGEKVTTTEWHNVVFWRRLAEVVEKYVTKGSKLYVEGKITHRTWDDKEGNKRYTTEIVGNTMQMLDKKSDTGTPPPADDIDSSPEIDKDSEETDDLPF
ncbi:single-stranded DNA-binding protein, partial [Bacteroidota bacterium]